MISLAYESATIILVRERKGPGFEVYLLKRSMGSNFMAGNYVYPGGKVDEGDRSPEMASLCDNGPDCSPGQTDLPFRVAGIRELFEEAGILLANDRWGRQITMEDEKVKARFREYRDALHGAGITMRELAEKEGLLLRTGALRHFAHWITPEARPIRFDNHFFIAPFPPGQEAMADEKETTHGVWVTPEQALGENMRGTMVLSPPTLKTLEDMIPFNSFGELWVSLKEEGVSVILPVFVEARDYSFVVFPWDPEYGDFIRGCEPRPANHGVPSAIRDHTTRVIMRDGRTIPYCRKK
jgi:8-oxo-dGTP pyrophosphatase MutT (NUDIX family)